LQTMAASMAFRKLMVPVMIKSLRCDPKAMYEGIAANKRAEYKGDSIYNENMSDEKIDQIMSTEGKNVEVEEEVEGILSTNSVDYIEELFGKEFHVYPSLLPYYVNMNSRMIVTYGVEIEDLLAFPIPRKSNIQDLKLESYQFVANEDSIAIGESHKQAIKEYLKVCSSVANKIKEAIESNDNKVSTKITDDLVNKYLSEPKDNHVMLKMLNDLYKGCLDENRNIDTNQVLTEMQTKPEYDLSRDMINEVSKNEHLIRAFVDIVSESIIPKKEIKVVELNLTNGFSRRGGQPVGLSAHLPH